MMGLTILELQERMKAADFNLSEYYQSLMKEAEVIQSKLNAFVSFNQEVLDQINELDQDMKNHSLFAIPYVLKDNVSTKDMLTTASSKMLSNYQPFFNATVKHLLDKKNTICLGKASMDELGMGGTNRSAYSGAVLNPWNTTRIPGGSSGGSAALVASGLVPFAIGTDTGDSIRKPAAYCGIVGMKPTYGLVSRYGVIPYASSLDHVGAFTRSVEDMAIVMDTIAAHDPLDFTSATIKETRYFENLATNLKGLKVAVIKNVYDYLEDSQIKASFDDLIVKLEEAGTAIEFVEFNPLLMQSILPVYTIIANAEATANHACLDGIKYGYRTVAENYDQIMIRSRTDGFSANNRKRYVAGSYALATDNQEHVFKKAKRVRRLINNEVEAILNKYDVILTPAAPTIAPLVDEKEVPDYLSQQYLICENHLVLGNFTGMPSISIPSGFVKDMPIGINLMCDRFKEQELLNIAYSIEQLLGLKNQYAKVIS